MSFLVVFVIGYLVGCMSALLLCGLVLAGRRSGRASRQELIGHDA